MCKVKKSMENGDKGTFTAYFLSLTAYFFNIVMISLHRYETGVYVLETVHKPINTLIKRCFNRYLFLELIVS